MILKKINYVKSSIPCLIAVLFIIFFNQEIFAQSGSVDFIKIDGKSLDGNFLGDPPERNVAIYLPPNYVDSIDTFYPVVYLLHGFNVDERDWLWQDNSILDMDIKMITDILLLLEKIEPMIIVMPNCYNKYHGCWYTNSEVTGNWEDFIVNDVIGFVDSAYRTLAHRQSRGIAGLSMGGNGAFKIAMKHPQLFSALFCLSASYISFEHSLLDPDYKPHLCNASKRDTTSRFESLVWQEQTMIAAAAAFAPNKDRTPFYGDFPLDSECNLISAIWTDWLQHDAYTMVDSYLYNLDQLEIWIECGTKDDLYQSNQKISKKLDSLGITHTWNDFDGGHVDKVGSRVREAMLPFFSDILKETPYACLEQTSGTNSHLTDVSYANKNKGMAVGLGGLVLRTVDGGETWDSLTTVWDSLSSSKTQDLMGVDFINNDIATVIGENGVILRTTNGGITWSDQSNGIRDLYAVSFSDADTGVIVGEDGIIMWTTDGGYNLSYPNSYTDKNLNGVSLLNGTTGMAVGDEGIILCTTDGGITWDTWASGTEEDLRDVSMIDEQTAVVVGRGGTILRTDDGCETWDDQSNLDEYSLESVCFLDANTGFVVGGKGFGFNHGQILRTIDGGDNWESEYADAGLYSVYLTGSNTGTAVGAYGKIMRISDVTWIEENISNQDHTASRFSLNQNYPNPFNPSTKIAFTLPKSESVKLQVYNTLGQIVGNLVEDILPAGSHEVEFNARHLPSDLYFYRLQAGEWVAVKKMIFLK